MNTSFVMKPLGVALALALFAGAPVADQLLAKHDISLGGSAVAQSTGHGSGKGKGGAGGGSGGQQGGKGGAGHMGGKSAVTTSDEGDDSDDKKGPKYGGGENSNKPGDGDRGGKPVWAQEGISFDGEEVELGRLNVARAPEHVLERQYFEALNTWDPDMQSYYEKNVEDYVEALKTDYDNVTRYDSPLMNLALYKDLLVDGQTGLDVDPASTNDLAAIFLGSASDKTVEISDNTVKAINLILDIEMSDDDVSDIAEKAEAIREAILDGHG